MALLPLIPGQIITADGDYSYVKCVPGATVLVEIGGALGTASVTLGYRSLDNEFKAYRTPADAAVSMTLTLNDPAARVEVTSMGAVVLRVATSGGGTAISFAVTPVVVKQQL